ncbi:S8 family serine peptidase [Aliiglaciecola sp. LCG003]|uniref:S8 family serine peptidase n=1 Tax=Aliiglaciecola sp. LCG003 TaxID=3053655 RepID=UPI0025733FB3|nr:S8 family serine peptidase [Aliiglaciecola sp. LCG003]WJG08018.1 S8 family serine peptidase [Aliiglaciecola sp. LCG003]
MLRKQLTVLGTGCFLAMSVHSAFALSNSDRSLLTLDSTSLNSVPSKSRYIVQLKDAPAATRQGASSASIPDRFEGQFNEAKYDANSAASIAYRKGLVNKQKAVMNSVGVTDAIYTYEHSFNGFAASLSPAQLAKLKSNPNVLNIWPDELLQMDTSNTPAFLGLTAPGGLHTLGTKGENVIIGVVDSGVWPENPSLSDDGFDPIEISRPDWAGECDTGTDPEFACNNKLIGARYFNDSFAQNNTILPGEFDSPRDADGHGTHTITTAGGNEGVTASLQGIDIGTVSGIAPRARVAAYKVCWNGSAVGNSGCFSTDSVAAIDAATADGVDVINYSISGSRTAMTDPVHVAFFNAARGGVFSSLSAGNSGPGPQTVAHNVPWVTTVAASTYEGDAALVGNILEVNDGDTIRDLFSIPGAITSPIPEEGLSGELVAVTPALACGDGVDNPAGELEGKIALIARGTCNFSIKVLNAQNAGADGVVIYSDDRPAIAMGGDGTGITIPGVMISNQDGLDLAGLVDEVVVSVNMTNEGTASSAPQIGNQMAGFSSRGESLATADIIKPDITAPGVQILAGTSGAQIDSGTVGESYAYLSGTSMSSPHIAGMAALVREAQPNWSPSAIKSALMTSSYQGVTKEDGSTPADPFDFGAGHANPNSAVDPGLIYDATFNDYYAFLCGSGDAAFVEADYFSGACGALENAGFPTDASDLNIASIAIESLSETQTIRRYVNNVSDSDTYTATVEAPAGVDVEVSVYDFDLGTFVSTNTMSFNAGGLGVYEVTFSKNSDAVLDQWTFGSVTWSDGIRNVYSPVALKATVPPRVNAPESVNVVATRSAARVTVPVDLAYNGRFFAQGIGLDTADVSFSTVAQDEDGSFTFNEPGLGFYFVDVPEGTRIAKFGLKSEDQANPAVDLDLFVYACPQFSCSEVGTSTNAASDESVVLIDPVPLANLGNSDIYVVFVLGWSLNGADSVVAPLHVWTVDESGSTNMSVRASSRAVDGRTNNVFVGMRGLQSGEDYVGGIIYTDENGDENGLTVIEVKAQ